MHTLITRERPARPWAAVVSTALLLAASLALAQGLRWYKLTDRYGPLTTVFTCQPGAVTLWLPADWQPLPDGRDSAGGVVGRFAPRGRLEGPVLTVLHRPAQELFSHLAAQRLLKELVEGLGGGGWQTVSIQTSRSLGPMVATQITGQVVTRRGTELLTLLASQLPNDHALGLVLESPPGTRGGGTFLGRVGAEVSLPELGLQAGPADVKLRSLRFALPASLLAYLPDDADGPSAELCAQAGHRDMRLTLFTTWAGPGRQPADLIADIFREAHYHVVLPAAVETVRFGQQERLLISHEERGLATVAASVSKGSMMAALIANAPQEDRSALRQAVRQVMAGVQLLMLDFDLAEALQAGQEVTEQLRRLDPLGTWARPGSLYFRVEFPSGGEGLQGHQIERASVSSPSRVEGRGGHLVSFPNRTGWGHSEWSVDLNQFRFEQEYATRLQSTGEEGVAIQQQGNDRQDAEGEPVCCTRSRQEAGSPPKQLDAQWAPHQAFLPDPMEWAAFHLIAAGQADSPALFQRTQYFSPYPGWQLVRALPTTRVTTDLPRSPRDAVGVEVLDDCDSQRARMYFDDDGQLLRYELGTHTVLVRTTKRKFDAAEKRLRGAGPNRWFDRR